jgi:hypothetical protein
MALAAAVLMFGAAASLMSGASVAHHNVYHSLGKCGIVECPKPKPKQTPSGTYRGQ